MRQIRSADMCEGPILGKLIRYTIPVMLTGILQLLFNAADLVVVGRFCGSVSVAAVGATTAIINLLINFFIGLSVGAGVRVAQGLGAGDNGEVHHTIHTAIPVAIISGIVLTIVGVLCSKFFLELMGTPDDVIDLSAIYMKIYFGGVTASMLYNFGAAILRAAGDTRSPLIYLFFAGIINVVFNVFFVYVFHMDVAGVALATIISQAISATLIIITLIKRTDACHLSFKDFHIYGSVLSGIMKIGVPAGIQGSLFSISNVIIQSSVNSFGSVAMSGSAAGANLEGFVYLAMNSFHQAALNFTGQNYGASKYKRIGKITLLSLACVAVTGIVFGASFYIFATPLLSIYITDSAEAIACGILRLSYICFPYFLCGIMDVMTGVLRGMGSSLAPMIVTVLGVCGFRIGWIYTVFRIPKYHTLQSIFISYPISWILTFVAELIIFLVLYKKLLKKEALAKTQTQE